ncbi:MAG: preprotein translocase subunit SecG [Planctomycetota bacterium]
MMSDLTPMLTLGLAGWLSGLLTLGFLFVCVVMILIVLIQRPQGGGLGGAFGSAAGSGQTAFGAKTGDALTIATIAIFVIFLLSAIGLNFAARPSEAPATPAAAVAPTEDAAEQLADDVSDVGAGAESGDASEADSEPAADDAAETPTESATETEAPAEGD